MSVIRVQRIEPYTGTSVTLNGMEVKTEGAGSAKNFFLGESNAINLEFEIAGSAIQNIGIGFESLNELTQADSNVAIGHYTLKKITNAGNANVVVGNGSSLDLLNGSQNVAIGTLSLQSLLVGSDNTAIGNLTGYLPGLFNYYSGCTFLGANAAVANNQLNNATAIGYNAKVGASNSMVLGDTNVNVGIGLPIPTSKLHISGSNGYDQLRLETKFTPLNTNDGRGGIGDIAWDENYFYWKTELGWVRAAGTTWGI